MKTGPDIRDQSIPLETHKLFWRANAVDKASFIVWMFTRLPAQLVYNVLIPFQTAYGLQSIITQHFDKIGHYALNILLLGVAYCLLWAVGGLAINRNGREGAAYLQQVVFANYLAKDYEFFSNSFIGTLGAQATKIKDAYAEYGTWVCNGVAKQLVVVISSVAIIAYQSPLLAIVTLLTMLLILSFTLASGKWRIKYRRMLSEANSEVAGIVGDALGQGVTVKSFAAEEYEIAHLSSSVKKQVHTQFRSWNSAIPSDIGRILLAAIATAVLLLLTSRLYQQHTISIAVVILIQLYVIKLVNATQEIADLIKTYDGIMTNAHQAIKTMLLKPKITDPKSPKRIPANGHLDIALTNVGYTYEETTQPAIKEFNLVIKQGEKIGLVGYSGSGKTTLTKLLLRFMDIDEGAISISSINIHDLAQKDLRSLIAFVPQEPLLFHRSIADNIAYGRPGATKAAIKKAGEMAYVDEFVQTFPKGYDTLVGEKGVKLSGGQRQRVAIARALLKDAPILVLDEATSALDSQSEQYIQEALWRLMEDRTALIIAHRLSTIQRMDRIVVMDKGEIIQIGTHAELLKDTRSVYAKLWQHQSGGYIVTNSEQVLDDN
jgi:ATP-binding cassette subfamily B protein